MLQNSSNEVAVEFETRIGKVTTEIERLAPNMKAMTRLVILNFLPVT